AHYGSALELRPNWEKAMKGREQAEALLHGQVQPAPGGPTRKPDSSPKTPVVDPERLVDPNIHGSLLTTLHKATVDSDGQGGHFIELLENEIEPAIKELSTCLLYPDGSSSELDQCVQKFENALQLMRGVQRNLQTSIEKMRATGDRLLKV